MKKKEDRKNTREGIIRKLDDLVENHSPIAYKRPHKVWDESTLKKLLELSEKGYSDQQIVGVLGYNPGYIRQRINQALHWKEKGLFKEDTGKPL